MAFIDWNNVEFSVEPTWALAQFVDLIRRVNKSVYTKARASLDADTRSDLDCLMGLNPQSPIDATESVKRLIEALPKQHGFYNGFVNHPGHLFVWVGAHTAHRSITLSIDREGVCTVKLSTGTGMPSRFLEPWCRRLIRLMISDIESATTYYD